MDSQKDFSSPVYRRARISYILYAMFEYFVLLLISDAFLAKLLSNVGFKNSEIGVISSLISLAFIVQLFSILLAKNRGSKKKMILILSTVGQMLFLALYLLPFLSIDSSLRKALVYLFIIGAYVSKYLVATFLFQWANSYVDPNRRATFSATLTIISLIGGTVYSFAIAAVFNWFEEMNRIKDGFLFLAIVILISNLFVFLCLLCIKKEKSESAEAIPRKKLSEILKNTLGNKNFRRLILISIIWKSAQYFSVGFMGTFKTDTLGNGLSMSVLTVQIIAILGSFVSLAVTRPFGIYSDKRSFASGLYLSLFFEIAAYLCCAFTTTGTWFLIIGYTVFYAIAGAGNSQNSVNITYSYINSDYLAEALALKNSISGVFGFLSAVLAGILLDAIQNSGNTFLGIPVFGQQVLAVISALLCVICIIYMRVTIMKEKVIKQ